MESHRQVMIAHPEISGFVLAGGRSSRLGQDKVLLPWRGQTLLLHAVTRLQQVCRIVYVCGNRPDLCEHLPQSVSTVPDARKGTGPLGGIVSALEISSNPWNLLLAVDLPLVPVGLLSRLTEFAIDNHASETQTKCVIPTVGERPQPLCGLYHKSLAQPMHRALEEGKYKVLDAVQYAGWLTNTSEPVVHYVEMETFSSDQVPRSSVICDWFLNINTTDDLRRAKDLDST